MREYSACEYPLRFIAPGECQREFECDFVSVDGEEGEESSDSGKQAPANVSGLQARAFGVRSPQPRIGREHVLRMSTALIEAQCSPRARCCRCRESQSAKTAQDWCEYEQYPPPPPYPPHNTDDSAQSHVSRYPYDRQPLCLISSSYLQHSLLFLRTTALRRNAVAHPLALPPRSAYNASSRRVVLDRARIGWAVRR